MQDFAHTANFRDCDHKPMALITVSDGCSSGERTNLGATLLGLNTERAARHCQHINGFMDPISAQPTTFAQMASYQREYLFADAARFNLNHTDLLATSVTALLGSNYGFFSVQGDGVVAIKYCNGIRMHRFEWAQNAPFYPSYTLRHADLYLKNLHDGDQSKAIMTYSSMFRCPDGVYRDANLAHISFDVARHGYEVRIPLESFSKIEDIAVFSDGVCQIGNPATGEHIADWREVVANFMNFVHPVGVFARRRALKALAGYKRDGYVPLDDFSYAVMHLVHDDNEDFEPEGII